MPAGKAIIGEKGMIGTFVYTGFQKGFDKLLDTQVFIFMKIIANSYWVFPARFRGYTLCALTY